MTTIGRLITAVVAVMMVTGCTRDKRNRFLIPQGYEGWVCVSFSIAHAPQLPIEDGFRLVAFPSSGVVETSSPGMSGEGYIDEYYYVADGSRRELRWYEELWGGHTEANMARPEEYTWKVWVGPDESSFRRSGGACGPVQKHERESAQPAPAAVRGRVASVPPQPRNATKEQRGGR